MCRNKTAIRNGGLLHRHSLTGVSILIISLAAVILGCAYRLTRTRLCSWRVSREQTDVLGTVGTVEDPIRLVTDLIEAEDAAGSVGHDSQVQGVWGIDHNIIFVFFDNLVVSGVATRPISHISFFFVSTILDSLICLFLFLWNSFFFSLCVHGSTRKQMVSDPLSTSFLPCPLFGGLVFSCQRVYALSFF